MVAIMWLLASDGVAVPTYWFNKMAKSTKTFRIINAASGEPIPGFPSYRSFSAAAREAGHLNGRIPSPTNPLFWASISVGVFSA